MLLPKAFRGVFRNDDAARAVYSEAAGIAQIIPRAVAIPADADDVVALVKWAVVENHPLIPRGSGSSMAGGAIGDGIVVDLSLLDAIKHPVPGATTICCGPGALRNAVDDAARRIGQSFPR